jgi:hypothetical protein
VTGSVGLVEGRTILAAAVYGAASTITSPLTTSTRTCVPAEQALADSRSALNSLLIIQSRIIHHGSFYHGQTPHPCDRNECGSFALCIFCRPLRSPTHLSRLFTLKVLYLTSAFSVSALAAHCAVPVVGRSERRGGGGRKCMWARASLRGPGLLHLPFHAGTPDRPGL